MKLNLVADYDLCGQKSCTTFEIPQGNNLVGLAEITTLSFPATDGRLVYVRPTFLLMCESKRRADAVAEAWRQGYAESGRLYDYRPIDRTEYEKCNGGAK